MNPTFESIRLAIETRLATWDGVPVEYDGAPQSQELIAAIEANQSWVRAVIQHGNSLVASISDQPETRRTGLIQLQVFTNDNQGSRPAALLADSLANHFEYWREAHLTTTTASVQRIGPSDGWYQYNVSVPFSSGC